MDDCSDRLGGASHGCEDPPVTLERRGRQALGTDFPARAELSVGVVAVGAEDGGIRGQPERCPYFGELRVEGLLVRRPGDLGADPLEDLPAGQEGPGAPNDPPILGFAAVDDDAHGVEGSARQVDGGALSPLVVGLVRRGVRRVLGQRAHRADQR